MRPALAHPDCIVFIVKHDDNDCSKCIRDNTKEFTSEGEVPLRVSRKSSLMNSFISVDEFVAVDHDQFGFDFLTCMKLRMQSRGF